MRKRSLRCSILSKSQHLWLYGCITHIAARLRITCTIGPESQGKADKGVDGTSRPNGTHGRRCVSGKDHRRNEAPNKHLVERTAGKVVAEEDLRYEGDPSPVSSPLLCMSYLPQLTCSLLGYVPVGQFSSRSSSHCAPLGGA